MANHILPDKPEFNSAVRLIETEDPVHADIVNPLVRTLLLNEVHLFNRIEAMQKLLDNMATDNTYGGTALSSEATVTDAAAEFAVIRKTSSTAQELQLFTKTVEMRKGSYGFIIRMKVSNNIDANPLVRITISSNGQILEQRTVTSRKFISANKYQALGFNVDVEGPVTVNAVLLKNSANLVLSVDYIMFQPAQPTFSAL